MKHHRTVTLADVAREAGVAKSTASYAFSDPERLAPPTTEKILAAAQRLGYQGPSALGRALASGKTHVIAVVTKALLLAPEEDPFALQIIDGLSREIHELGYGVLMLPPVTDPQARRLHEAAMYDAAVSVRRLTHLEETDALLEARGVPFLRLDSGSDEYRAITGQDDRAIAEVIEHLVSLGHKRIATVALPFDGGTPAPHLYVGAEIPELLSTLDARIRPYVPRARLAGFLIAGVTPTHIAVGDSTTYEAGHAAGLRVLDVPASERPTAIVCQADVYAWGVVEAANELGLRVPEDVSVTGFDGLTVGVFDDLGLTTVFQDGVLKGRLVARWIIETAEREGEERPPTAMPLSVRLGKTTGPAPK